MSSVKERKLVIPKTLGACADALFEIKAERARLAKLDGTLSARYYAIEARLIEELPASEAEGIAGKLARATVVTKRVPSVKDWGKLYAHILKTKSFDLVQKRVSAEAVKERWDAKKPVPGVEGFTVKRVSLTKR